MLRYWLETVVRTTVGRLLNMIRRKLRGWVWKENTRTNIPVRRDNHSYDSLNDLAKNLGLHARMGLAKEGD